LNCMNWVRRSFRAALEILRAGEHSRGVVEWSPKKYKYLFFVSAQNLARRRHYPK
jgi:hypothetical protein